MVGEGAGYPWGGAMAGAIPWPLTHDERAALAAGTAIALLAGRNS
jgi:hypothetical protein